MQFSLAKCVTKVVMKSHAAAKLVLNDIFLLKGAEYTKTVC